jgi:hypothetical protein
MMAWDRLLQVVRGHRTPVCTPRFFREDGLLAVVVVDCAMDPTPQAVAEHGTIDDTG